MRSYIRSFALESLAIVVLLLAVPAASYANATGFVQTFGGSSIGSLTDTQQNLDLTSGQSYTSETDYWVRYYVNEHEVGGQNAEAFARVGNGTVGARAIVTGGGTYAPGVPHSEETHAYASALLNDSILITSTTLPLNTPVSFQFRLRLDGTSWANGEGTNSQTSASAVFNSNIGQSYNITDYAFDDGQRRRTESGNLVGQTYVGARIAISFYTNVSAYGYGIDGLYTGADYSHTLYTGVDFLTPGVSLVSDSGYDYTRAFPNPVPEPMSFTTLGFGVAALFRRRGGKR